MIEAGKRDALSRVCISYGYYVGRLTERIMTALMISELATSELRPVVPISRSSAPPRSYLSPC